MIRSLSRACVLALCLPATVASAQGHLLPEGYDPFLYRDPEAVTAGRVLYEEQCAACHGSDLEGQPDWQLRDGEGYLPAPPHDATGHTWHHGDGQLFAITKRGTAALAGPDYRTRMEGFADVLTDREILAYIKSRWPAPIKERHDRLNAAMSTN